jgi:hypothetical protein
MWAQLKGVPFIEGNVTAATRTEMSEEKLHSILFGMCVPRRNSCKTAPLLRPNLMQISLHKSVDTHTALASSTSLLSINL